MFERIGLAGVFGLLVVAGGLGLVAWANPLVAAGLALIVFGFGVAVQSVIRRTIAGFGFGGFGPGGGGGVDPTDFEMGEIPDDDE